MLLVATTDVALAAPRRRGVRRHQRRPRSASSSACWPRRRGSSASPRRCSAPASSSGWSSTRCACGPARRSPRRRWTPSRRRRSGGRHGALAGAPGHLRDQHLGLAGASSARARRAVDLGDVPDEAWDAIALARRRRRLAHGRLGAQPRRARRSPPPTPGCRRRSATRCPTSSADDIVGSPYCIRRYVVDAAPRRPRRAGRGPRRAGRRAASASCSTTCRTTSPPTTRGSTEHPERFVQRRRRRPRRRPGGVRRRRTATCSPTAATRTSRRGPTSCSSTPSTPACARRRSTRCSTSATSATACAATWRCCCSTTSSPGPGATAPAPPPGGLLADGHRARCGAAHPDLLFLAEAYWDLEWALQQQGFDHCYDKRLYDRLVHEGAGRCGPTCGADPPYQRRAVRFLENHDEPRAAGDVRAGQRAGRGGRRRHAARRHAVARGAVRGPAGPAARVPAAPPGRARRRRSSSDFDRASWRAIGASRMARRPLAAAARRRLARQPDPRGPAHLVLGRRRRTATSWS